MKAKIVALLLCYAALIQILAPLNIAVVKGATSVNMKVEQVVWGTSPDNPVAVSPGDVNVPLTVIVVNLAGNRTIKGIHANLTLNYPFKSSSGGFEAGAVGEPREGDILNPSGEVPPAGSFSLTFRLDIGQDAKPGSYYYNMSVYYMIKETGDRYKEGEPQRLTVRIFLPDRAPVIDSFTPMVTNPTLYIGDFLNFSSRSHDPDGDNLTFRWLIDGKIVSNSSFFIYAPTAQEVGNHNVELRVSDGNLTASQVWNVLVDKLKKTEISVPNNFLTGGSKSSLNITIKNNLWKGRVQVDFTANQPTSAQSLIVYGNHSWIFSSMQPGYLVSVYPELYAPSSSIGMTYTATVTVTYNDEYGRSYTDTLSIGLIVRGMIRLMVYDVESSPQPARPGSAVTITATFLNKGNIDALNVNASIQPSSILQLSSASRYYLDKLEKNSPEPFSLRTVVSPNVQNGTYPVTLSITYQDDQLEEHVANVTTYITVARITESPKNQNGENSVTSFLNDGGWTLIILLGAAVVLLLLYIMRLKVTGIQSSLKNEGAKNQAR